MKFHLKTVLSAATGIHFGGDFGDTYKILNHMTGENLFTHQIPRAGRIAAEYLKQNHPLFKHDDIKEFCQFMIYSESSTERWDVYSKWIDGAIERHGLTFDVEPMPKGEYESMNPIEELVHMRQGDSSKFLQAH